MPHEADPAVASSGCRSYAKLTGQQAVTSALKDLTATDSRFCRISATGSVLAAVSDVFGIDADEAISRLITATSICFDANLYVTIPIIRPYTIRDRSKRGGKNRKESWGVPRDDGYFCDDNTMLKRMPATLDIQSTNPLFNGKRVDKGWTACHAWRALENGRQASSYGVLNTFMPVLTWVPSTLSRATDVEGSRAQTLLKDFARSFRLASAPASTELYIEECWKLLQEPSTSTAQFPVHRFAYNESFVRKRINSIREVAEALHDVTSPATGRVLSTRYTAGLLGLNPDRARLLSEALHGYATSVERAADGLPISSFVPFP
jgi:hypothetical protein